jgi:hypothetical protein
MGGDPHHPVAVGATPPRERCYEGLAKSSFLE